jgi:DNA polymerase elongation subunit (family B)
MWIFDSYYKGCVHLWARDRGLSRTGIDYPPSFYLHLKDPHAYAEMIEALECLFRVEECSFKTIYGPLDGYRIYAERSVAEKIEKQTRYAAELYNVDVRRDQQYLAQQDLFPCGEQDESRFSPDFNSPLRLMELRFSGDPGRKREISGVEVCMERPRRLEGRERIVLSDLLEIIRVHDPDVILFPQADLWTQLMVEKAKRYSLDPSFSRSGWFRRMAARSYWSYGKVNHKDRGDTPDYVRRMQQELFDLLAEARSQEELQRIEPRAQEVHRRYMAELGEVDVRELAIHRRVSRLSYSRKCAEASAMKAHRKEGIPLAPGMEIGYVMRDAAKWAVDIERDAFEFDVAYYSKLLKKAWSEVAFVFLK